MGVVVHYYETMLCEINAEAGLTVRNQLQDPYLPGPALAYEASGSTNYYAYRREIG